MPVVSNNSAHCVELLSQSLSSPNKGAHQAFNQALQMQAPQTKPTTTIDSPPNSTSSSGVSANTIPTQSATNGASAPNSLNSATFNATGNLSTPSNLNDFALLKGQNILMEQVRALSQSINTTQAAALQPSVMLSLGMLQKLYDLMEQRYRARNNSLLLSSSPTAAAQNSDELSATQQAQVLSFVFMERFFKLFENGEKHHILSRFFKKGPLGENEHDTNTDDEYGNSYADVDAETDYIKRPRRDKPGMAFHHSLLR